MTLLPPTPEQQKCMDKELPPDSEMRKQDIIALREWFSKQPHLPNHIDNEKLERFLYNCKNSVEKCKLILEKYYSARTFLPEFFGNRDPLIPDVQESFDTVYYFVLPSLTEEGHRVTILRFRDTDSEKFSFQAMMKRILMTVDVRLLEESCLSNIIIVDCKESSAGHLAKFSPTLSIVRRATSILDTMPYRISNVYVLHSLPFITSFANAFRAIFKEKLFAKLHFYNGGEEELYTYMNKDILPNEWGGKAGTFEQLNDAWRKKIEKNRDWFLQDEKLNRTDESARLPESKASYFVIEPEGIQGSFRKLNID